MGMKEIITVKASTVQVGDIICGLGVPGHNRTTPPAGFQVGPQDHWIPAHTVLEVAKTSGLRDMAPTPIWWLVTESLEGRYVNEMGPFSADSELHVVARSVGDALIGRGR